MTPRPSYTDVDYKDKEAYISSRNDVLNKSFVTDLWMKVILRAIDDVALYTIMRVTNKKLREEDLENESSALGFLFDEDYRIPMDDYLVDVICPECKNVSTEVISDVAGQRFFCSCGTITRNIEYTLTGQQRIKDISLRELISLWGIDNIEEFRTGLRRRIDEIIAKKLEKQRKSK